MSINHIMIFTFSLSKINLVKITNQNCGKFRIANDFLSAKYRKLIKNQNVTKARKFNKMKSTFLMTLWKGEGKKDREREGEISTGEGSLDGRQAL